MAKASSRGCKSGGGTARSTKQRSPQRTPDPLPWTLGEIIDAYCETMDDEERDRRVWDVLHEVLTRTWEPYNELPGPRYVPPPDDWTYRQRIGQWARRVKVPGSPEPCDEDLRMLHDACGEPRLDEIAAEVKRARDSEEIVTAEACGRIRQWISLFAHEHPVAATVLSMPRASRTWPPFAGLMAGYLDLAMELIAMSASDEALWPPPHDAGPQEVIRHALVAHEQDSTVFLRGPEPVGALARAMETTWRAFRLGDAAEPHADHRLIECVELRLLAFEKEPWFRELEVGPHPRHALIAGRADHFVEHEDPPNYLLEAEAWWREVATKTTPTGTSAAAQASHSSDFTSVTWFGTRHSLSARQAVVVRALWKEWEACQGSLSEQAIGEIVRPDYPGRFRLRDIFKRKGGLHAAWGTMIRRVGQGTYALVPPDSHEIPT